MNSIKQMFNLQAELNAHTNGANWADGITQEGRHISWLRCIYMEAAEAINSLNWKHWKDLDGAHDWANVEVELVDIWHFIMSEAIYFGDTGFAQTYENIQPKSEKNADQLIEVLERIIAVSAGASVDKSKNALYEMTALFFEAISIAGMDINALYRAYVVKNQLNTFRQNHGYKTGEYQKNWAGVEDNVVAFDLMRAQPELSPEDLMAALEKAYRVL